MNVWFSWYYCFDFVNADPTCDSFQESDYHWHCDRRMNGGVFVYFGRRFGSGCSPIDPGEPTLVCLVIRHVFVHTPRSGWGNSYNFLFLKWLSEHGRHGYHAFHGNHGIYNVMNILGFLVIAAALCIDIIFYFNCQDNKAMQIAEIVLVALAGESAYIKLDGLHIFRLLELCFCCC